MLAVTYQAIVLLIQKAFNIREMVQVATEGIKSVVSAILILSLAYCINAISKTLGTSSYVISVTESWMTPVTLLALTFAVCAFMAFFTGTSWGVYAIMIPIVMPLAFNMTGGEANNLVYATIAAVMGGGCFGDHCSPPVRHHHPVLSGRRLRPSGSHQDPAALRSDCGCHHLHRLHHHRLLPEVSIRSLTACVFVEETAGSLFPA